VRPERPETTAEPGEWPHGWQYYACDAIETYNREQAVLPTLRPPHRALVRSASGPGAGHWLLALPTSPDTKMDPELFQAALRRRLRLPLQLGPNACPGPSCRRHLDPLGDHLASCPRAGGVQRRAKPLERAWQRVFREAGARVVPQAYLRDLDLGVSALDGRRVDLVARGLPLYHGVALCGDATMVSPLHADGSAWSRAADVDGVALQRTRDKHEDRYPELVGGERARLLVLGCEIGGRWDPEALMVLNRLAAHKAQEATHLLRRSARLAWHRRWLLLVSVAAQRALTETLLKPGYPHLTERDDEEPWLGELFAEVPAEAPQLSRVR
jgi:hypothetical protein